MAIQFHKGMSYLVIILDWCLQLSNAANHSSYILKILEIETAEEFSSTWKIYENFTQGKNVASGVGRAKPHVVA